MSYQKTEAKHPFPDVTLVVKKRMKTLRLLKGYSMYEGADLIGTTRKQLEDIETSRPYGCHISLVLLTTYCKVYGCDLNYFGGTFSTEEHAHIKTVGKIYS